MGGFFAPNFFNLKNFKNILLKEKHNLTSRVINHNILLFRDLQD